MLFPQKNLNLNFIGGWSKRELLFQQQNIPLSQSIATTAFHFSNIFLAGEAAALTSGRKEVVITQALVSGKAIAESSWIRAILQKSVKRPSGKSGI